MNVDEALMARISVRDFLSEPLSEELVREILNVARFAPSGGNVQPWRVIAVAGDELKAITALARTTLAANPEGEEGDRPIYPANLWEPYRTRRFEVGEAMYALLGVGRDDRGARFAHLARNFEFFGAPAALFFVIDKRMGHGQWAHLGMFMQSIAMAAIERGVSSCMQEAWARIRETLARHFALDVNEMIYCGMALGYASDAVVNTLRSARAPLAEISEFRGFS